MEHLELDRLLTQKEVMALVGIRSRTSIYRRVKDGTFPPPVAMGHGQIRWRQSDFERWSKSLPNLQPL